MKIAVASGKGGTGKTLVAVSLALSLSPGGEVQLLDCDVEEPNDHLFLRPVYFSSDPVLIPVPEIDEATCSRCGECARVCAYHAVAVIASEVLVFPQLCHGCGACSYFCPEKAITERGREIGIVEAARVKGIDFVSGRLTVGEALAPPVIREVKRRSQTGGTVIIDAAPGTSCPVVEAVKGCDFCLLVTEPTPFGLNDLELAVEMVRELALPFGVVLNRAGTGDGKTQEYCRAEGIEILLTVPLDAEIARLYSRGVPLVAGMPDWKKRFVGLFDKITESVCEGTRGIER
jgi:MinD superfamily P-loop ATPase